MNKIQKKGIGLNQAFGAILTLVLVAILVIVAIYMFSNLETTFLTTNTAGSNINESVLRADIISSSGATLTAGNLVSGSCGTVTKIWNGTGSGVSVVGTNMITQVGCNVKNSTTWANVTSTSQLFDYNYTYSASTSSSNASGTIITQFVAYPALVGLVGTIIFLALVIGVLVASFVFGGKRGA